MIYTKKYAVRFPETDYEKGPGNISLFSERSLQKTEDTFLSVLDAASSVAKLVIQKNRTKELEKRLEIQKRALDSQTEDKKEQLRIKFYEEAQRMEKQLETKKVELELEFKKMKMELRQKDSGFQILFEEDIKTSKIFYNLVIKEREIIEKNIKPFIVSLEGDYSRRREYIKYCELERQSLNLVSEYLQRMI